jgi:hypothetical protein
MYSYSITVLDRPLQIQELRLPGLHKKETFMEGNVWKVHGWDGKKPSRGLLVVAQHKMMEAVSKAQKNLEANYWRGQDPKRIVAPFLKGEEKKNQIKRSTCRSRILYTANRHVFTCIPVFLHWALRWNCKLDLHVELDDPAEKTKPNSIWPCFWAVLLTGDNLTKRYTTCVLRTFVYILIR